MTSLLFQVLGNHGGASAIQAGTKEMVCEAGEHAAATCCLLHSQFCFGVVQVSGAVEGPFFIAEEELVYGSFICNERDNGLVSRQSPVGLSVQAWHVCLYVIFFGFVLR